MITKTNSIPHFVKTDGLSIEVSAINLDEMSKINDKKLHNNN